MKKALYLLFFAASVSSANSETNPMCENKIAILDAEFEGARMSSCKAKKKSFVIEIDPENKPINPSPWYGFRVTAKNGEDIKIKMNYSDSKHRYRPKITSDRKNYSLVPQDRIKERKGGKQVRLELEAQPAPFIVTAQEILLDSDYSTWRENLAENSSAQSEEIGHSVDGRTLYSLSSSPSSNMGVKEYVLLIGRQHPPELTGALAMLPFLETVYGPSDLATRFRERFHIISVPIMNPDGVANGHWRHNVNGIDLNRDWGPFTQPETQAVKKILDDIDGDENSKLMLMFDFHSTNRNVFYTQASDEKTDPERFTEKWIEGAKERLVDYEFERAERHQTDKPTSKQYVFTRFGAPAITYELGDQTGRSQIRTSGIVFAEEMMKTLLSYEQPVQE